MKFKDNQNYFKKISFPNYSFRTQSHKYVTIGWQGDIKDLVYGRGVRILRFIFEKNWFLTPNDLTPTQECGVLIESKLENVNSRKCEKQGIKP